MKIVKRISLLTLWFVFGLTFLAWAQGIINLPKTGQTISYATGDDGDLQMGVPWPEPRFIDNADGTITDSLTGLMWTKNANLLGQSKTYREALEYVSGMNTGKYQNFGYADWRMPNIVEIESLINAGESNNATRLNTQAFINVPESPWWSNLYWSSSSGGTYTNVIWFHNGQIIGTLKTYSGFLWPVRSAQPGTIQLPRTGITWSETKGDDGDLQMGVAWPELRFIDNRDGTIKDNLTGLIWTKNANLPNRKMAWQEALNYVASLNESKYLGYSDWRLPNRKELSSLVDHSKFGPPLSSGHPFTNISGSSWGTGYWTSSTYAYDPNSAWGVWLLWGGEVTSFDKTSQCYVWSIRAGELPPCIEKSFTESTLVETLLGKKAILNDVVVTGDFESTLDFTNFEVVDITTGPFAGKGFSKGECQTTLEGISYTGNWRGISFIKPQERKIYLKGVVSGEISAIVEGYLIETVPESGTYDLYQATWKIGRLGTTTTSVTIKLNGIISYQASSEFPSTELYILQTNIEGTISGHYAGPLNTVLTHLRIVDEISPYYGEGFSIISYASESGSGEGWTYDKVNEPGKIELRGMFISPLFGIVSAILDETELPRKLLLTIERVDLGLPPAPDLKVKVWGPERVSPGQTIDYIIEYRNDGVKAASEAIVYFYPDLLNSYKSASQGAYYNNYAHRVIWNLGALPAKSVGYSSIQVEIPWGLSQGLTLENRAYVLNIVLNSTEENGASNGMLFNSEDTNGNKDFEQFKHNNNAKWFPLYDKTNFITGSLEAYLASKDISTSRNGVGASSEINGFRPQWIGHCSSATTYVNQAKNNRITGDVLYLISPQLITQEGLQAIKDKFNKIIVYQGDDLIPDTWNKGKINRDTLILSALLLKPPDDKVEDLIKGIEKAEGNKTLDYLEVFAEGPSNKIKITWTNDTSTEFTITHTLQSEEGVDVITIPGIKHAEWIPVLNKFYGKYSRLPTIEDVQNLKEVFEEFRKESSGSSFQEITTARDPNELLVSPEGDVRPGDRLNYTINYENEGEGIAFGVYISDTLEEDLDDSTLVINNNGTYDPETRTLKWFIGEIGSKKKGSVTFSINVNQNAPDKAEVINFATVYFPSVPEATRTNGTVSRVTTSTDTTPPTTTASVSPIPNQSGWNNTDVTVTLSAVDNEGGSGVAKTEYSLDNVTWTTYTAPFTITNEGATTVYYKSTDNIGNTETTKTQEIKIDKTPPTISSQTSPQPNSSGWNKTDVTVSFTAADALSGIATFTQPVTVSNEGKDQNIGGEAIDLAGNKATTYATLNIDKTQPVVIIKTPQEQAEYLLNRTILADWPVTDSLSGVASAVGTVPNGSAIDTASVGTKAFSVAATDNAGNKAERALTYYVRYSYSGVLPPINQDGSSIFKLGRNVPVKFQLKDSSGNFISTAVARIYLAKINDNVTGTEIEVESTSQATTGNLFRYDSTDNQYIFNLSTSTLSEGTWQIRISLDDGTSKYVNIELKK